MSPAGGPTPEPRRRAKPTHRPIRYAPRARLGRAPRACGRGIRPLIPMLHPLRRVSARPRARTRKKKTGTSGGLCEPSRHRLSCAWRWWCPTDPSPLPTPRQVQVDGGMDAGHVRGFISIPAALPPTSKTPSMRGSRPPPPPSEYARMPTPERRPRGKSSPRALRWAPRARLGRAPSVCGMAIRPHQKGVAL